MRPVIYIVLAIGLLMIVGGVALAASPTRSPCDIDLMVEAIRQVENWDGHSRGAAGERGPWQITPSVWDECSDKPFSWADGRSNSEKTETRRVAREKLYRISARLTHAGYLPDAYTVALVWSAGWDAFFYRHPRSPSKAKRDYADRARNLYDEIRKTSEETPLYQIEGANPSIQAPITRKLP